MKERTKVREEEGEKWSGFFLIEVQLEEEHVCLCLCVLCSRKKVKHAPNRARLHTQALNGEQVGRCRDGGVQEKGSG